MIEKNWNLKLVIVFYPLVFLGFFCWNNEIFRIFFRGFDDFKEIKNSQHHVRYIIENLIFGRWENLIIELQRRLV